MLVKARRARPCARSVDGVVGSRRARTWFARWSIGVVRVAGNSRCLCGRCGVGCLGRRPIAAGGGSRSLCRREACRACADVRPRRERTGGMPFTSGIRALLSLTSTPGTHPARETYAQALEPVRSAFPEALALSTPLRVSSATTSSTTTTCRPSRSLRQSSPSTRTEPGRQGFQASGSRGYRRMRSFATSTTRTDRFRMTGGVPTR